jgi:hypothetical protein
MSEAFGEAFESEAYESSGEAYESLGEAYEGEVAGEAVYEGEGAGEGGYEAYGEDARSDARRRARQRQIMLARQRQAQLRRRPTAGPPPRRVVAAGPSPTVRAIRADVRTMDLDTQAALIRLRRELDRSTRMAYRNAWVAELSTGASQVLDSFEGSLANHDWARAIIRTLPDVLLAPGNPGDKKGLERVLFDPRVGGSVLIAGIWAIGHFTGRTDGTGVADGQVASIKIPGGALTLSQSGTGASATVGAIVVDQSGASIPNANVRWWSQNSGVATVTPQPGQSATVAAASTTATGTTKIFASAGGKSDSIQVSVAA